MKIIISAFIILFFNSMWSQNLEAKIKDVENGLTLQMTTPEGEKITKANILQRLKQENINGASVAVIHNGKLDWSKTYGVTDVGGSSPVTSQTLFQSASIGKVITSIAVLSLVQEGKLNLDENVNNFLKRWKIPENENTESQKVSLRHLLSHSAGLTDDYGFIGYDPKYEVPTLLQILNKERPAKSKKSLTIETIPGMTERYSGGGYLIIQLLIEDVCGVSFSNYVSQVVFDPLQMIHSTYDYQPDNNLGYSIAAGHRSNGKLLKNKKYNIYPERGAAGPWTTAEDLAKLIIGIQKALNDESKLLLDRDLIKEFLTPQINNKGLGINLKGINKPEAFWHAGQNLGYTGLFYGLVEKGDGAVILMNSDGGERFMQEFITSVAHVYNWPVMKSFQSLAIPEDLKTKLMGRYQNLKSAKELVIEQEKKGLVLKSSNSQKGHQLYRIGNNNYTFKNAQDYYKLTFKSDGSSIVSLIYTESIGKIIELDKIQ